MRAPLEFVTRRGTGRAAAAIAAFAARPQPLTTLPARSPVVEPLPIERIEERLRESISVVTEHAVRRELEHALRPGAHMNRRLRESIQSELYDEIVFERERRGER